MSEVPSIVVKVSGIRVVLVSSGSVGLGTLFMKGEKPKTLPERQAAAAVGQGKLMQVYNDLFSYFNQPIAQILLSRQDLADESRFHNSRSTVEELLKRDIIPILNENDTTSTESIRFSDNDTLASMVAGMIQARWLFLLTDVDALYDSNPNTNPNAKRIPLVQDIDEISCEINTKDNTSKWGTGGMKSKITAARLAVAAGTNCVIMKACRTSFIKSIMEGNMEQGTLFVKSSNPISKAKLRNSIQHGLRPVGILYLNDKAKVAILNKHSLSSDGIIRVEGDFQISNGVRLIGEDNIEIGIGIVNFSSNEIRTIMGKSSKEINELVGYFAPNQIIFK